MIFPLACATVTILLDGIPVRSYRAPYILHARVMAPVYPFVVDAAASVEYDGPTIVVRRGDLFAQVPSAPFVAIGPLLRTLGLTVTYDPRLHRVLIETPRAVLATPTPFNPAVPQATPASVFTPEPQVTPRPVVTGKPLPRRTPLPANEPQSRPSP